MSVDPIRLTPHEQDVADTLAELSVINEELYAARNRAGESPLMERRRLEHVSRLERQLARVRASAGLCWRCGVELDSERACPQCGDVTL